MGIYRLYSGVDDESHLEEMDLSKHPELTEAQGTTNIMFREWGMSIDGITGTVATAYQYVCT